VQHSRSGGITRKCGYLCEDRVARASMRASASPIRCFSLVISSNVDIFTF
jgi:hypothetical protein